MASTLTGRCGTNATVDDSNPSDVVVKLHLNDLTSIGFNPVGITAANFNSYVDKWISALLLKMAENQPTDDTDPTVGVYVSDLGNDSITTRTGISQIRNNMTISHYRPNTIPAFDPDNVINS